VDYRVSVAGLLIGLLIGLTGMGGGSLLAPILILFFRVPPAWAIGTDMAYSTITKAVGSIVHIRQRTVNFRVALWLACGSVPATCLSVTIVQYFRQHDNMFIYGFIQRTLGVTLLVVAVLLIVKPWLMKRQIQTFVRQFGLLEQGHTPCHVPLTPSLASRREGGRHDRRIPQRFESSDPGRGVRSTAATGSARSCLV
jgi:uncharacterized membrane protein YfcA